MEEEEGRIDLSLLTVDDDEDADETSTDEDETSSDDEDDGAAGWPAPPIHFAQDLASPPPESILLDVRGYVDARENATTAGTRSSKGSAIQVTFWAARPPRVSCFTVHCDGLHLLPTVLAAEGDLVFLKVAIAYPDHPRLPYVFEHYIYHGARATAPTLRLLVVNLPECADRNVGILPLRDGEFLIAAIWFVGGTNGGQYDLHLFDSRTWTWTTRRMHVDGPKESFWISPTKVLGIGGERGSMDWVDLQYGVLFCDLLAVDDDGAMLRYMPLPPLTEKEYQSKPPDVRDLAVVRGRIKFFEMRFKEKRRAITSTATLVTRCWKATTWEKTDPWQNWRKDCVLDIFKVPLDKSHAEIPPHLHDMGKLHGCQPALSLHEEDVVYIMAKAKGSRRRAWMLALDVRKKTLREVAAYNFPYLKSWMSNHLIIQSSTK